jgi:hypothetical protein
MQNHTKPSVLDTEQFESAVMLCGPFAIGAATACYGAMCTELATSIALGTGWLLWLVSMIVVIVWKIVTANEDGLDAERVRLGYKPRPRR